MSLCFHRIRDFGSLLLLICMVTTLRGQDAGQGNATDLPFEFHVGDRIVFVGNSLIEEASHNGILEWMFLNAWPDKNLSFRNLGWSGDTAEGKARSYISKPPEPYDLLVQQIDTLNPAMVVLGYGNIEAYEGLAGLDKFEENLGRLIDDVVKMGAQPVLLSTIPQVQNTRIQMDLTERNSNLEKYASRIGKIAASRGLIFVDLFDEMKNHGTEVFADDGILLNETGYYRMGGLLIQHLGKNIPEWRLSVDARTGTAEPSKALEIKSSEIRRDGFEIEVEEKYFPVYVEGDNVTRKTLLIEGLKKGVYALSIDGEHITAATHRDWADGVHLTQGRLFDTARHIQRKLKEINELYFWEYRPLNRTYLVGFRRYEQGQNSYELGLNSLFIDRLEEQIFERMETGTQNFRLTRIK